MGILSTAACAVDWIAFTVPLKGVPSGMGQETLESLIEVVDLFAPSLRLPVTGMEGWQWYNAKGFYRVRAVDEKTGVALSWGETNPHVYVEISGLACRNLESFTTCEEILKEVHTRASRVDISVDLETDCKPDLFISNNEGKSFKSRGHIQSESGDTCYIGSRKSEQFCRVYRYHDPHPRSHLLRVEVEHKGDKAKAAALNIVQNGILSAAGAANAPYGWTHAAWTSSVPVAAKLKAPRVRSTSSSRMRWLYKTIPEALRRAERDGLISLRQWLEETELLQSK